MFREPTHDLLQSLAQFATAISTTLLRCDGDPWQGKAYKIDSEGRRFVFVAVDSTVDLGTLQQFLKQAPIGGQDSEIYEVAVVVTSPGLVTAPRPVGLGLRVYGLHDGLAYLTGLPRAWRESQYELQREALRGASPADTLATQLKEVVELRVVEGNAPPVRALTWLTERLHWDRHDGDARLVYLRGEAGKGKSTTLATFSAGKLSDGTGPLPLLIPLRELKRASGVSWEAIASRLGVTGPDDVRRLALAVRSGLVALLLDGLDEVAGRYDPSVVEDVLRLIETELLTPSARVVVTGRTTESTFVNRSQSFMGSIELPDDSDPEFVRYVRGVVERTIHSWPDVAPRILEPLFDIDDVSGMSSDEHPPTDAAIAVINDWISIVFEDLGKERSLFFVQSLAGAARSYQLAGNRPVLIRNARGVPERLAMLPVQDVCLLAASLACVREQDKVEQVAAGIFTPTRQLDILSWFAVLSSVPDSVRNSLPLPNSIAKEIFDIDPINDNETFSAVIRQMQKHALLFAGGTQGARGGEWRPTFLSEWVRAALLVRAWQHRRKLASGVVEKFEAAIARAERGQLAYGSLFSALESDAAELSAVLVALRREVASGSPEASANYLALISAVSEKLRTSILAESPVYSVDEADFTELTVVGVEFGKTFSPHLNFFDGVEFDDCIFNGCQFNTTSMRGVGFYGCQFDSVRFEDCDGPIIFVGCTFRNTRFRDMKSGESPALEFQDCHFESRSRFDQTTACGSESMVALATFEECTMTVNSPGEMIGGEWTGLDLKRVSGLTKVQKVVTPPEVATLRSMLKTFFPSRVGDRGQRQVRPYIRSSALGRGSLPKGAPTGETMFRILEAFGFTDGGRANHLYAPWSSVAGGGPDEIEFRNELNDFLSKDARSVRVTQLLERIRRAGTW